MFFKKSIVIKLWAAVTALILLVSGISAVLQTRLLENIYYDQQAQLLVYEGQEVAGLIKPSEQDKHVTEQISLMAHFLKTSVVIVNREKLIQFAQSTLQDRKPEIGKPFYERDLEKVFDGNTIISRGWHDFWQTEVLSAAVPIKVNGKITGAVIIYSPLAPIAERIRKLKEVALYTALVGVLLATALGLVLSRRLSRPLLKMNEVAQAIAQGDFNRKVTIQSSDEMGLLAGSLNKLSGDLQETLARLKRLDQTRRDFVANVSHELRTPLTIIMGFTDAILLGLPDDENERDQYLLNIQDETQRLQRLVNELLDLRKMEAGQIELKKLPVHPALVIDRVLEKFDLHLKEKNITIVTEFQHNLPVLMASEDHLERIFNNLLGNAVRFSPADGTLTIKAEVSGSQIIFSITDCGPGISAEELHLIWERFYKADKSRSRTTGTGTGLGLAITKQIVEAHGGKIEVKSTVAIGTTFTFTLPLQ